MALVVAPISGALSDRSQHRRGRRRLFLIAGVLGTCVGLLLLLPFGPGASLWLYAAAFIFLQFWWNWVAGAYAGLIPDVMAEHEQGRASAWLNILSVAGTVAGNVVVVATYKAGNPSGTIAAFVTLNIAILVVMLRYVREPQPATQRSAFVLGEFLRLFYVDPCVHANFYWVLVTRLLGNMGIWSVNTRSWVRMESGRMPPAAKPVSDREIRRIMNPGATTGRSIATMNTATEASRTRRMERLMVSQHPGITPIGSQAL